MTCPTPRKRKFVDRAGAVREAARIRHDRRLGRQEPYQCSGCGFWHLATVRGLEARIRLALNPKENP
jgi:hypothetical protein